ncbi:hypothetical protein DENSPDRAFT_579162 [Dentipellis sp. KUC8613]|nr:hypothetical protein DENSPDRAFT_579162 [Dentipellis sp. KUC8613]
MATGDYHIFRHRGLFFIWHTAIAPLAPPLSTLADVPHAIFRVVPVSRTSSRTIPSPSASDAFNKWAHATRAWLEHQLTLHSRFIGAAPPETEFAGFSVCKTRVLPRPHGRAYEADLDTRTFLIDGMPIFRLDHMPPFPHLERYIGCDAYGHPAPLPGALYHYAWNASPPRYFAGQMREYEYFFRRGPQDIHRVLGTTPEPTPQDTVRIRLLETLVGNVVADDEHARLLCTLERVSAPKDMPPPLAALLHGIVFLAAYPMAYCSTPYTLPKDIDIGNPEALLWPRHNLCVLIWSHLDDKPNLRMGVTQLAKAICTSDRPHSVVHGILISGAHIVVVRFRGPTRKNAGERWTHSAPLPFLPSRHGLMPSPTTPGLVALARLCARFDKDALPKFLQATDSEGRLLLSSGDGEFLLAENNRLARLPHALLVRICTVLPDRSSQMTFACLCKETAAVVRNVLSVPTICADLDGAQYTLLRPVGMPDMCYAAFDAVDGQGNEVEVRVGYEERRKRDAPCDGRIKLLSFGSKMDGMVGADGSRVAFDLDVPFVVGPRQAKSNLQVGRRGKWEIFFE